MCSSIACSIATYFPGSRSNIRRLALPLLLLATTCAALLWRSDNDGDHDTPEPFCATGERLTGYIPEHTRTASSSPATRSSRCRLIARCLYGPDEIAYPTSRDTLDANNPYCKTNTAFDRVTRMPAATFRSVIGRDQVRRTAAVMEE